MLTLGVNLLLVLIAGLLAGMVCHRIGTSLLVGYLVVGALIGEGGLGLVTQEQEELEYLAQAGALLLLFAIGIEFSLYELLRLGRYFLLGGSIQMLLVGAPVTAVAVMLGTPWQAALLLAAAAALSSTVLVYKALEEYGQADSAHGRRAVGILLFQDVALAPLMLLVPLLTGGGDTPTVWSWVVLGGMSVLFVIGVLGLRVIIGRWAVPLLARMRRTELVVLFSLVVLGGASLAAYGAGLPPALGAFAAGLILSDNRLTGQIDALLLPYRETFAAIFFVTLGSLMHFDVLLEQPLLCLAGLAGILVLKSSAATVALKATGLPWQASIGTGLGLSQLGELSFMLLSAGMVAGVVATESYDLMLFLAIGTLILTPMLLRRGLRWSDGWLEDELGQAPPSSPRHGPIRRGAVIGAGPIGSQVASQLELRGLDICLMDLSPVNLHPFAQQGFHTVAGDAQDPDVLERADAEHWRLAVVTVPDDHTTRQIVRTIRQLNADCTIVVRCRFLANVEPIRRSGADAVVSEEAEASTALARLLAEVQPES